MNFRTLMMTAAVMTMSFGAAHAQSTTGTGDTAGAPNSTPSMATPSTAADAKADAAMAPSATTTASSNAKVSHMTKSFIENASAANMFEIETSKVALTKAQDQKVKDFAQKMIDDHTKAGDDMKAAISSSPKEQSYVATKLPMMKQHKLDSLSKDDAKDFDKDYVNAQVDAHKEAVDLFGKYAQKGDDASLKTFATNTLPTLQGHKQMIDGIKASMAK